MPRLLHFGFLINLIEIKLTKYKYCVYKPDIKHPVKPMDFMFLQKKGGAVNALTYIWKIVNAFEYYIITN